MRWIVITLLVLNVAYFGWEFSQREPVLSNKHEVELPELKGESLKLLTERLPAAESRKPPPPIPVPSQNNPVKVLAPGLEQQKDPLPQVVDSVEVKKGVMCTTIGPIEKQEVGVNLVKNLKIEGYESVLQALELSREVQYWVLLPPFSTRKEALQSLKELQTKKIDSYLLSSGEMKNAISLGLFKHEQSAKGVLTSMLDSGFKAEMQKKERINNEYWVRILPGQPIENLQETLETLVVSEGSTKISSASCEMFAQTQ